MTSDAHARVLWDAAHAEQGRPPWGEVGEEVRERFREQLGQLENDTVTLLAGAVTDGRKLVVRVNSDAKMSRGKYAAQAVHAALNAVGAHPGCPVVVLGGKKREISDMPVQVRDAGLTELEPGTLTAGAEWQGAEP